MPFRPAEEIQRSSYPLLLFTNTHIVVETSRRTIIDDGYFSLVDPRKICGVLEVHKSPKRV